MSNAALSRRRELRSLRCPCTAGLGLDVLVVAELSPRADDGTVIDLAGREEQILLTEDKDFGQLVYANGLPSVGVILLRSPAGVRLRIGNAVAELVTGKGDGLLGVSS